MRGIQLLTVITAACGTAPTTLAPANVAPPPTTPVVAATAVAIEPTHIVSVVKLAGAWNECSNMGGEHAAFEVEPSLNAVRYAHAGGHGESLGLFGFPQPARPTWYVADLALHERVDEDHDGNPDSSVAGWCLDGMPHFDAEVVRLWDATDLHDANQIAARVRSAAPLPPPRFARGS